MQLKFVPIKKPLIPMFCPFAAMIEPSQTVPVPDGAIYDLTLLGQSGHDALCMMLGRVDADRGEKITFWLS